MKTRQCCFVWEVSKPQSSSLFEKRDKGATDVESQNPVHGPNKFSSNEDDRNNCSSGVDSISKKPHQCSLHVFSFGVLVKLMNSGVNPHATEEPLHCMAHATATHTENHHSTLRGEPNHSLHLVFFHGPNPDEVVPCSSSRLHLVMHYSCKKRNQVFEAELDEKSMKRRHGFIRVEKSGRIEEGVLYLSDVVAGRVSDSEGVLSVVSTVVWFIPSMIHRLYSRNAAEWIEEKNACMFVTECEVKKQCYW